MKKKAMKLLPTEEFIVKFLVADNEGFKVREERSFKYHSKNRHEQARKDCIAALKKEGRLIDVISCIYQ